MSRIHVPLLCCAGLALTGCGPIQAPLPARLNDDLQKSIDESWEKTLSPLDRFDNQSLLDLLLMTQAYQLGVDKLEFRSEKSFSGGVVIMESRFERSTPERDLFAVTVQDRQGKTLRQERYTREQIETTFRDLGADYESLRQKRERGTASPEEVQKLAGYQARLARVESVFPKRFEDNGAPGDRQEKPKK